MTESACKRRYANLFRRLAKGGSSEKDKYGAALVRGFELGSDIANHALNFRRVNALRNCGEILTGPHFSYIELSNSRGEGKTA
jgi:hypothetical protein